METFTLLMAGINAVTAAYILLSAILLFMFRIAYVLILCFRWHCIVSDYAKEHPLNIPGCSDMKYEMVQHIYQNVQFDFDEVFDFRSWGMYYFVNGYDDPDLKHSIFEWNRKRKDKSYAVKSRQNSNIP